MRKRPHYTVPIRRCKDGAGADLRMFGFRGNAFRCASLLNGKVAQLVLTNWDRLYRHSMERLLHRAALGVGAEDDHADRFFRE